jgi:hypothetical protein
MLTQSITYKKVVTCKAEIDFTKISVKQIKDFEA